MSPVWETKSGIYDYIHGPQMRFKQQQFMNKKKQDMQRRIREAEKKRIEQEKIKTAQDNSKPTYGGQWVQQNIQTYGNRDRPNEGMNVPGGGKGQSPTGGDVAGTPFVRGGRASYFNGGLASLYRHGGF